MICHLCGYVAKNTNSLGKHIHNSHKEITKEEYYNKYIDVVSPICECGELKKFRGLGEGYRQFCSVKCRSNNKEIKSQLSISGTGKTQSEETVRKRIENTNQSKKEQLRKQTMIEKYGVDNPSKLDEVRKTISEKAKGRKSPPRTEEHSRKISEAKRLNGTLKQSKSARNKITNSLNEYYQNGDDQSITVTSLPSNGRGHKTGHHNGILYRSSYELLFIIFCEKNDIQIESCENKERRVRYEYEGKKRWYYPDFYLTDFDVCVEIKPTSMMNELFLVKKQFAEKVYNKYVVVSENELLSEEKLLEHLYT